MDQNVRDAATRLVRDVRAGNLDLPEAQIADIRTVSQAVVNLPRIGLDEGSGCDRAVTGVFARQTDEWTLKSLTENPFGRDGS